MARVESSLLMRLIDGVSGPAARVESSLRRVDAAARRTTGTRGAAAQGRGGADPVLAMAMRGIGAGAAAAAVAGAGRAFVDAAEYDRRISRILITAEAARGAAERTRATIAAIARETALPTEQVVAGLDALVQAGRSLPDAMAFLPSVARSAQASGAEVADMARTADALGGSLKIGADQMQAAFDILVAGGKAGKFELKDMAQYLPAIAPAAAAIGIKGEAGLRKLVASLQMVRQQTGTSEAAATNFMNVLQKMESRETANAFKRFGIDLPASMKKARASGKDLLDVFLDLTDRALKGDISRIPQLFADMQAQQGMRALMSLRQQTQGLAADLAKVDGATMEDFKRVIDDSKGSVDRLSNSWGELTRQVGRAVTKAGAADVLDFMSNNLANVMEAPPEAKSKAVWLKTLQQQRESNKHADARKETEAAIAALNDPALREEAQRLVDKYNEAVKDGRTIDAGIARLKYMGIWQQIEDANARVQRAEREENHLITTSTGPLSSPEPMPGLGGFRPLDNREAALANYRVRMASMPLAIDDASARQAATAARDAVQKFLDQNPAKVRVVADPDQISRALGNRVDDRMSGMYGFETGVP